MAEPKTFVHLHNHSDFSLLDGASKIDQLTETAARLGMPALAVTDHGNLFGAIQFHNSARKRGVTPIIGCEVYVAKESRHKKTGGGDQANHLILLASDLTGYQNLSKLVSFAYLEGFYYKPRMDKELLARHSKGLIALSACLKGSVPERLLEDRFDAALEEAAVLRDIFGERNFFLELQDQGLEQQRRVNPGLVDISKKTGIPLICTNDAHYLRREDAPAHDVLLCIGTGRTVQETDRMRYASDQFYFKSFEEMRQVWSQMPEAMLNTLRVAERCDVRLEAGELQVPNFSVPAGFTPDSYFEKVAREGFESRRPQLEAMARAQTLKKPLVAYEERLAFEIEMIKSMKFSSYFLIVWDLIKYARDSCIPVGPGRGSVVGSLAAYSLRITDIDPLQYDLFFERFLNPERIAPPDIDMDFCMNRRSEVIGYVADKYGRDNVCQIITFGTMAAKGVIRDVGRTLDIPYGEVDRIAKLIPNELNATIDKALEAEPRLAAEMERNPQVKKLIETAKRLEGLSRHASTHAAGVVIAPKPLVELVPLYKSNKDEITTQYSMKDVEAIGLLKMDFLGLTTLTVLDQAVRRIRAAKGVELDLGSLPLNDAATYQLFAEGRTNGIFQFESGGMKAELRRLRPERFEDLIALNALYRPGPMDMIADFVKRKHGTIQVRYPHPVLEEILKETYGVIVYQEQVMQIASRMAGFSLGEADILRKAMGKKLAKVMTSMREKFIAGARRNKINEKAAAAVFDLMEQFAQYGFNKSHSTAYALLAYQTAYLKVHYPVEFMASVLSSEVGNTDKIVMYIAECRDMGIPVLPPDINESELDFRAVGDKIRFGMLAIRNVGEGAIQSMLESRKKHGRFRSLFHLCGEVDSRAINKRVLESLIKSGALDSLGWKRSQLMALCDAAIEYGQKQQRDRESGQRGLFSELAGGRSGLDEPQPPDLPEWPPDQLLAAEKETLGYYLSGHPLERFSAELGQLARGTLAELVGNGAAADCAVGGIITEYKTRRTKKGDLMAVFKLEDLTAAVETVVFPSLYARVEPMLASDAPVLVSGRFEAENESAFKIVASDIQLLSGATERNARTLHIRAAVAHLGPDSALELYRLLERNRGETGVELELYHPHDFRVTIQSSDFVRVRSSPELVRQIESICGQGSVQLIQ
ncbi:MAG: DNA polymerase III subunit alpha [Acidobacteria bacterium]|nr:MAG: DNA polymerase III subunit alpha [Acidobacteriota bacterium]